MFCRHCGAQLPDGSTFCSYCGQPVGQPQQPQQQQPQQVYQQPQTRQQPYQQQYPQQSYQQQPYQQQQSFQQPYQQPVYRQDPYAQSAGAQAVPQQGMKWHKFLVYFALWASAVIYLIYGIIALTGAQYGEYRDLVYSYIPGMKAPDMIYGFLLLCLAVLAVLTALSLLKYKAKGPKLLTFLYLWSVICSLFYLIWAVSVLSKYNADTSDVIAEAVPSLVTSVIMIIINRIYYNKRAHLFVN